MSCATTTIKKWSASTSEMVSPASAVNAVGAAVRIAEGLAPENHFALFSSFSFKVYWKQLSKVYLKNSVVRRLAQLFHFFYSMELGLQLI